MNVDAVMTRDLVQVTGQTRLEDARVLMDKHVIRHLPVVENEELVGILSDRDILEATGWLPPRMHECRGPEKSDRVPLFVKEVSHSDVIVAAPEDDLIQSAKRMLSKRIGCLPVVESAHLVGILTEIDVLGALRKKSDAPQQAGAVLVSALMTSAPVTVNWYTSFREASELCRSNNIRHLPVLENSRLVGIVSDRDLRRAIGEGRSDPMPISELMSKQTVSISPEATIHEAADRMDTARISALPVVSDGLLVGIITLADLLEKFLDLADSPRN